MCPSLVSIRIDLLLYVLNMLETGINFLVLSRRLTNITFGFESSSSGFLSRQRVDPVSGSDIPLSVRSNANGTISNDRDTLPSTSVDITDRHTVA